MFFAADAVAHVARLRVPLDAAEPQRCHRWRGKPGSLVAGEGLVFPSAGGGWRVCVEALLKCRRAIDR